MTAILVQRGGTLSPITRISVIHMLSFREQLN